MNFDENLADFGCGLEEEGSMSKNGAAFLKAYARTSTVLGKVAELPASEKEKVVESYLKFCYESQDGKPGSAKNPVNLEFGDGFESITSKRLPNVKSDSFNHLLLVEFFTHCCINCIHSIEDVRRVHEEIVNTFSSKSGECSNGFKGIKVLSVHSPKFPREKDLESIKSFCKRMRMEHSEVVNDPGCVLWNEFGVTCWPTLLVLGPNPDGRGPNLLFNLMGEGHKEELLLILKTAMTYLQNSPMQMRQSDSVSVQGDDPRLNTSATSTDEMDAATFDSFFKFPGKVAVMDDKIVVSDSGNNRLVLLHSNGNVEKIIGGPIKGNQDGNFKEARFYNPQGIAFSGSKVCFVADTGNHCIRKIDLQLNQVSTLVSAGSKTEINGEEVTMKSPWDLAFYTPDSLIIAAAGNHRLFGYFFNDTHLFGVDHKANTFAVIAGSGREENRNNSYILKASFAQPSGLSVEIDQQGDKVIFIADSESSSIRSITAKAQVVGIVGGSRDPTDLFAFGDTDGKAFNAKLQHPMGVCAGRTPSEIFIADTYNHKIKRINVQTKECEAFVSSGLQEPSGLCKDPARNFLYVADTNNHAIKVIDIDNANVEKMNVTLNNINLAKAESYDKEFYISTLSSSLKLNFCLSPLPGAYEGGQWKIVPNLSITTTTNTGTINAQSNRNEGYFLLEVTSKDTMKPFQFLVVVDVYFCTANSCIKRTKKISIFCAREGVSEDAEQFLSWKDISWD